MHPRRKRSKMVAVVMEKCLCDTDTWSGLVNSQVGGKIYFDRSGDLKLIKQTNGSFTKKTSVTKKINYFSDFISLFSSIAWKTTNFWQGTLK